MWLAQVEVVTGQLSEDAILHTFDEYNPQKADEAEPAPQD